MDDETIDRPLVVKKPYTRPQLHELMGSEANGKSNAPFEIGGSSGPS